MGSPLAQLMLRGSCIKRTCWSCAGSCVSAVPVLRARCPAASIGTYRFGVERRGEGRPLVSRGEETNAQPGRPRAAVIDRLCCRRMTSARPLPSGEASRFATLPPGWRYTPELKYRRLGINRGGYPRPSARHLHRTAGPIAP